MTRSTTSTWGRWIVASAVPSRRGPQPIPQRVASICTGTAASLSSEVSMPMKTVSARALVRFQVVSAYLAIAPPRGERAQVLERLAAKPWSLPDGRPFLFRPETLRGWVRAYQRHGLEGLEDTPRARVGVGVLTPEQIEVICALKRQVPERSLDRVIQIAEELDKVPKGVLKRSTVHRVLKAHGLSKSPKGKASTADLDRFEAAWPNDLWQSACAPGPTCPTRRSPAAGNARGCRCSSTTTRAASWARSGRSRATASR